MREIKKIIVHCSDSDWGTVKDIDKWHNERGWDGCGYHYVITNGVQWSGYKYAAKDDGIIQIGRPEEKTGAHVRGHNSDSIGICVIGKHHFTGKQMYDSLPNLLRMMMFKYSLTTEDIYGHYQFDPGKTCPNFDIDTIKELLKVEE
jgi:N-acetylmuramoyl-L-alanine amidase